MTNRKIFSESQAGQYFQVERLQKMTGRSESDWYRVVIRELARGVIGALGGEGTGGFEGMEARPVTVEEIEAACAEYGVATVGLEDGVGLDVLSVETLGLIFEERA